MKRRLALAIGLGVALLVRHPLAQGVQPSANAPDIPYEAVPGFLKWPANIYMGEGIGVATNSKGHVFVYTRARDTRLFEFDQRGAYVREIGQGLYGFEFAHSVRVDAQDNIWAVDEGTNMVIKFTPDGRVAMVLGRRPDVTDGIVAGPGRGAPAPVHQPYAFGRPTDIGFDPAGNIFVSDGYVNSRVVKYDKNGRFVKSMGERGAAPGQFNLPHTIAVDAKGWVYVGDRTNNRIQVLDNDLNVKTQITGVGAPWAVCITPGPHQYLYSSNSFPDGNDSRQMATTGLIYKMELDGTVIGKFGKVGKEPGELSTVHMIDCRTPNELYLAEITTWRVQKIVLHPRVP